MEKVEIPQNRASTLKQISNVHAEAAGRHFQTRVELKYTSLRLRQKPVILSLQLLNSKTIIGNRL